MEKIIILANREDRERPLVRLLMALFPECEICVISRPDGTDEALQGSMGRTDAAFTRGRNRKN